jgi:7,8-dihydroneopterin aldolase/epimerase/oxygenase
MSATKSSMRVCLNDLIFKGYHGLYDAEKKLGNTFRVDVIIDFTPKVNIVDQMDQTIDYVEVYQLVKKMMETPTPLLETLVCKIADQILLEHTIAQYVLVKITKETLPILFFEGKTSVSIEKRK